MSSDIDQGSLDSVNSHALPLGSNIQGGGGESRNDSLSESRSESMSEGFQISSRYDKFVANANKKDFSNISRHNILSHGGVDSLGRTLMVFSACNIPPSSEIDLSELLEFCVVTLDRIVESDYCLVYFHACMNSAARPPLSWFRKCYRILSRKYKKNLKTLYIVHPTLWIRLLMGFFKPFISYKFWDKIIVCNSLSELRPALPVNQLSIPKKVCIFFFYSWLMEKACV